MKDFWSRMIDRLIARWKKTLGEKQSPAAWTADPRRVKDLISSILSTREDEIDCDQCFDGLDRFVELALQGDRAAQELPLVWDHLGRCPDCREEYEALLAALNGRPLS